MVLQILEAENFSKGFPIYSISLIPPCCHFDGSIEKVWLRFLIFLIKWHQNCCNPQLLHEQYFLRESVFK